MKYILLLIFIFFHPIFSEKVNPRTVTVLQEGNDEYPLGLALEIERDTISKSFEEIKSSTRFQESKQGIPNFGFTKDIFWIRFTLENQTRIKDWYLYLSYPLLDNIEFYEKNAVTGKWNIHRVGDMYPFESREFNDKSFVFPLSLEKNQKQVYYFRIQSEGTMQFPLTLYSPKKFLLHREKEEFAFGIYYGILLVLVIYNLILLFMLKDIGYLYYLLYVINYGASQSILNGLAFQYLWPNSPYWANRSLPFLGGFALLCGIQFTRNFLNSKKNVPMLDKLLIILMGCMGFLMLSSFILSYFVNIYLLAGLVILFAILIFVVGIVCWDKGYKPARYFIIAWVSLLFGVGIFSFKGLGILPTNLFTEYGLQVGSAVEMCLLSLGLAYKITIINQEKAKAEKKVTHYRQETQDAKLVSARMEVELLKNNIHPHFLLNSINATIIWLDEDPASAKKLLSALSEELHYILKLSNKKTIYISEEIQICKRYLEIMSLRKDMKFSLRTEGVNGKELIPPIALHTLVENGVTHGYPGKKSGEFILTKKVDGKKTRFILFNDGLPVESSRETSGTGIKYIRSRLEEAFPGKWEFYSKSVKGGWENGITILS